MEAFSLLRYWRSNGGAAAATGGGGDTVSVGSDANGNGNGNGNVRTSTASASATTMTIVTAVSNQSSSETGDEAEEEEEEENDHGPFFDLEFSLGEHGKNGAEEEDEDEDGSDEEEDEREMKFTLVSGSSGDSTADRNVSLSPSDELFFKGRLVPDEQIAEANSKSAPQFRVSLMKSATKFRVMMLKFKKSKSISESEPVGNTESGGCDSSSLKEEEKKNLETERKDENVRESGKSSTVKFKVEEVPIVSLFKRENSKGRKKRQNAGESVAVTSDEKKFSKEAMQRYLRKVKPLYVRVSKKYGEKLKFSGQLSLAGAVKANLAATPLTAELTQSPAAKPKTTETEKESTQEVPEPPLLSTAKQLKQGNLPAGLRVVCKHLGKSRSASTAVAAAPPGGTSSKRRDDSLLQQQDGIQSAILHCKRSFKASRDIDSSNLSRSTSDSSSSYGKGVNNSTSISSSDEAAAVKETVEINKSS